MLLVSFNVILFIGDTMKKWLIFVFLLIVIGLFVFINYPQKVYDAKDFDIEIIKSDIDYDKDGIDDYSDILEGAKIEADKKIKYKSAYYEGGYPPDGEGVATDVIWRSLKNAGYDLKSLIDEDIKNNIDAYPNLEGNIDPNIDFRRVANLKIFFERHCLVLTNDPYEIDKWMPGDIVAFGSNHIGIISDIRNKDGIPYLISLSGNNKMEDDNLIEWYNKRGITGHYRFLYE